MGFEYRQDGEKMNKDALKQAVIESLAGGALRRWQLVKRVQEQAGDEAPVADLIDEMVEADELYCMRHSSTTETWTYSIPHNQEIKTDAGKPLAGCLLEFGRALEAMARIATYGAAKYGRGTWRRVERERYIDAFMRHVLAMGPEGMAIDEESNLPHLAHAIWNVAAIIELTDWEI